jgi:hypothetical protein
VIWDNSVNTGFNSNITGIGRDDNSELNQKQPKSLDDSLSIGLGNIATSNLTNVNSFTNDRSYLLISHNGEEMHTSSPPSLEHPVSVASRLKREVLVVSTNHTNPFFISWKIANTTYDLFASDLRLLVDVDDNFLMLQY